jgi:hypothetical protein
MVMGMRSSGFQCFSSISSCASAAISSARDAARRWGCRTPVDGQRALRRRVATDKPRGGTAAQHGGATAAYAVRVGVGRPARAGRRVRVPVGADMPRSLWLPHPHSARGTHRTPPSGDEMTDCESDQVCPDLKQVLERRRGRRNGVCSNPPALLSHGGGGWQQLLEWQQLPRECLERILIFAGHAAAAAAASVCREVRRLGEVQSRQLLPCQSSRSTGPASPCASPST